MSEPGDNRQLVYRISPQVSNGELNKLFDASWPDHAQSNYASMLDHSLLYVCAYQNDCLLGFVNVAWDGGIHAFILDTTVHPKVRRQGVGVELVRQATTAAQERGIEWMHVDFEPHLRAFYQRCGFRATQAGLINLKSRTLHAT